MHHAWWCMAAMRVGVWAGLCVGVGVGCCTATVDALALLVRSHVLAGLEYQRER
eukprot:XP_001692517.1 predicted protein [Chlamydomonas reinhardtii]